MKELLAIYGNWISSKRLPRIARSQAGREIRTWAVVGLGLGVTEGSVAAVIVKNVFDGSLEPRLLNQAVAIVAGAPALANLLSFYWADFGAGRAKVSTVTQLLLITGGVLLLAATAPVNGIGLALFIVSIFLSRVFWTGALTLRAPIWRANYPREVRANFTAKATVLSSFAMAVTSAGCGLLLEQSTASFRYIYPGASLAMLAAALLYRRVRVRRHRQLLTAESEERLKGGGGLNGAYRLLNSDTNYRRYLTWMFLFGGGNLMLVGQTVLILNEQLELSRIQQMLIVSSIPLAVVPLTIPLWADLFDRSHVARFRSIQGWFFTAAIAVMFLGIVAEQTPLLWVAAVLLGTGYSGGMLGWHLGHNAFASDGRATDYMALHVTLTGIRGIAAPIIGVGFYQALEGVSPGSGGYSLLLPLAMSALGTVGFGRLANDIA